jgi:hypothetical protein
VAAGSRGGHRLAIILVALGAGGSLYGARALHRVSDAVLAGDMSWPRPSPYPDAWLAALNDWYDARYPVPPDLLKRHGELSRIRLTVGVALAVCLLLIVVGMRMGAARRLRGLWRGA